MRAVSRELPHNVVPPAVNSPPYDPALLRSDARENRRRILRAARETFAERGLDVPLSEVVRRSGVGAATLYRRFPTREALIVEVFTEQVTACVTALLDATDDPDPWRGFCTAIQTLCTLDAGSRGFARAFLTAFPGRVDFQRERQQAEHAFADLVQRAKDAGELRQDFGRDDLTLLLMANGGLTHHDSAARLAASHKLAGYLLRAFRATRAE